jgi:chromosome segregation ATPase
MIFREQQHKLEAQIENLQRKLSMEREAVQELDATCERLAGMERVCQDLREENRRLEDDISRWERLAESEESRRHVSIEFSER